MRLHDAIDKLLRLQGRPMTAREIADALNQRKWYTKGDGSLIQSSQIRARVNKHQHLFSVDGPLIYLQGLKPNVKTTANKEIKSDNKTKPQPLLRSIQPTDCTQAGKMLMNEKNFKPAAGVDQHVPVGSCGLYCIRIADVNKLPAPFNSFLNGRGHNILYIGIASNCLYSRFLQQELRAIGHGTFFRSLGAVLGYLPSKGSLSMKANKRNFRFSAADTHLIIEWINQNLLVNWVEYDGDFNILEDHLIKSYLPLLNLAKNPKALPELKALRAACVKVATQS